MIKPRFRITKLKEKIVLALIALGFLFLYYFLDMECIFRKITHLPCPGCGMSRAYSALLDLDIIGAFSNHPMFWAIPVASLFVLFDSPIFSKKIDGVILGVIGIGFFVNWIIGIFCAILV